MTNNYVLLNGKLSRDIEVSKNDKGNSFVKFCLICTRDGNSSYSDYVNCIAFGEIANAICRKGEKDTAYHIEGNIRTNSYEKNGIDWNSKRINGYYGQYVICILCSKRTKTEPTSDQAIEEWNHHVLKKNIQLTLF